MIGQQYSQRQEVPSPTISVVGQRYDPREEEPVVVAARHVVGSRGHSSGGVAESRSSPASGFVVIGASNKRRRRNLELVRFLELVNN